jgi:predicted methyltransferase
MSVRRYRAKSLSYRFRSAGPAVMAFEISCGRIGLRFLFPFAFGVIALTALCVQAETMAPADAQSALRAAVANPQRSPKNVARDIYRHPVETLSFFGVTPDETIVELWPGAGWYTEILAPMLRSSGKYIAATEAAAKPRAATTTLLASDPQRFDKVVLTTLEVNKPSEIAPAGSADVVLTFRNIHNFLQVGSAASAQLFADCYRALKPGGVLGVVDHRLPEEADPALEIGTGYVKRSTIVALATAAGFKFDGESAINANPKDDHQHPKDVWTLPPIYALGDTDRAKYQEIGESDRLTLRFVKPM